MAYNDGKKKVNPKTKAAGMKMINENLAFQQKQQQQDQQKLDYAKAQLEAHAIAEAKDSRNLALSYSIAFHSNIVPEETSKDEVIKTAKVFEGYITGNF